MDSASFPHYNNTKIIIFVEDFLFYESFLMDCHFWDLLDFQSSEARLMTAKSLLGNTRITEHNTCPIYGRPKLSLIVPRNSGNRSNPENDSP